MFGFFKKQNYITSEELDKALDALKKDMYEYLELQINRRDVIIDPPPYFPRYEDMYKELHYKINELQNYLEFRLAPPPVTIKNISTKNVSENLKDLNITFTDSLTEDSVLVISSNNDVFEVEKEFLVEKGLSKVTIPITVKPIETKATGNISVVLNNVTRAITVNATP
jgi:hypothetical protein